jgi:hypothetical protein
MAKLSKILYINILEYSLKSMQNLWYLSKLLQNLRNLQAIVDKIPLK